MSGLDQQIISMYDHYGTLLNRHPSTVDTPQMVSAAVPLVNQAIESL